MLLISDANIFIDLEKMGLLKYFDCLGMEIATSDFVYNELNQEQQTMVSSLKVEIYSMDSDELLAFINAFQSENLKKISLQDYSIFHYAKKHQGEVLSNDKRLRIYAAKKAISVKGLFYILDEMVTQQLVTPNIMTNKLLLLKEINKRVPSDEIDKRIKSWSSV